MDLELDFFDSDLEDLEELEELMLLFPVRRPMTHRERTDLLSHLSDAEFIDRYRLSKDTVMSLSKEITPLIESRTMRNRAVPPLSRLLIALRFYGTGCMLEAISDFSGVSKSSGSRFVQIVSKAITSLSERYIQMPQTVSKIRKAVEAFAKKTQFPNVIGAIGTTHVRIQCPGGKDVDMFRNLDGFYSLKVQSVSGPKLEFVDIVKGCHGSIEDDCVFKQSSLYRRFDSGDFGEGVLVGSEEYKCRNFLLTPLTCPVTDAEVLYNDCLERARASFEQKCQLWKKRFPVLLSEMRLKLGTVVDVISATAVLHNVALRKGESLPSGTQNEGDDDPPQDIAGQAARQKLIDSYFASLNKESRVSCS